MVLVALALCPQPSQELGDPFLGLLPDALLCLQLCVELEKSISRMEASLKRMRGGNWGSRAGGWCPERSVGPLQPHVCGARVAGGCPIPSHPIPNTSLPPAVSPQLDPFAAIDLSLLGRPDITAEHGDVSLKVVPTPGGKSV